MGVIYITLALKVFFPVNEANETLYSFIGHITGIGSKKSTGDSSKPAAYQAPHAKAAAAIRAQVCLCVSEERKEGRKCDIKMSNEI